MKKLLIVALLLISSLVYQTASSQVTVTKGYYNGAYAVGLTIVLDSNATSSTTQYQDLSQLGISGGTIYCTYSYVQNHWNFGAGNDTSKVILIGKDILGNTLNCDTVSITCVSYLTQAAGVNQTTLSLSSWFPEMAVYVAPKVSGGHTKNGKLGILYITFWGNFSVYPRYPWIVWQ